MNSRVSWSVEGVEPSVRERAEAAAKRAGLSLGDWISSQVGDTPPNVRSSPEPARPPLPDRDAHEVAEIHQRLDSITRQIEQISRPAARSEPPGVARQLNDAISRLDARLSQISEPARPVEPQRQAETVERAAANVYRAAPPISPGSLDFAIAEITARQSELDAAARNLPPRSAPPIAPAMAPPPGPDFSGLERHLIKITSQIEALQRPDGIEQSIAAFREELAEIRQTITEAMPRRAIESIENEIRSLSQRIDDTRQNGIDANALAGVERALGEIREALRSLTPAEQLAGFDDAIRNLGGKIDMIVRASDDPGTLQQLEGAIAALRAIVSNVASNEALARLSDDVHALSSKVDQLARTEGRGEALAALEQRIADLTSSLDSRERPAATEPSAQLEGALSALSDRIDRMPVGNDSASAFAHLEQRVAFLLERLEMASGPRTDLNLGRIEEGLQDILRHLERQSAAAAAFDDSRATRPAMDPALVDTIKRELSEMRFSQSQTDRNTQDSLEAVHNTLGHVVDRLAMIEGDLRSVKAAPLPQVIAPPVAPAAAAAKPVAPQPRLEMPNPAAAQFEAAPRQFAPAPAPAGPAAPQAPKALRDILDPPAARGAAPAGTTRLAIDPALPPDHPLEPGTRPGRVASPSERIAASENALSELTPSAREQANTSNFIAAARRAAQAAAAAASTGDKSKASGAKPDGKTPADGSSTISSKIRSLLVGASVVVIVLGAFKTTMNYLDNGPKVPMESGAQILAPPVASEAPAAAAPAPAPAPAPALIPAPAMPSMTSPTPIGRQSLNAPAPAAAPVPDPASADVTGAIPAPQPAAAPPIAATQAAPRALAPVAIPVTEKLPEAIGGPALRAAALRGDPSAAYEVGLRFAEGKGVTANYDEAAKWYGRAADAGVIPAVFRLGTLYEKGLGVKKDFETARRYYIQAAERGNAKAMHNLAVLEADGGARGANYKSAALWFRKAAERGVADSQFNLGILYARGIGVEQNLAESYKWFSLAAAQGDADSGRKRDDVARRLDPQSLSAAKLAIQTFTPEAQPDDAVKVAAPAGGWDVTTASAAAAKPTAKRSAR